MPRLNPDALTFGTFTSSYPPVAQVIESAQALEALGSTISDRATRTGCGHRSLSRSGEGPADDRMTRKS
jgi:hypothetical protein